VCSYWNGSLSTKEPLASHSDDLVPLQSAIFTSLFVCAHGAWHVKRVTGVGNTEPLDLTILALFLPGEPLVARGDQGPQLAALLRRILAYLLAEAWYLPPGRQPTGQAPGLVSQHVKLASDDPDPLREGTPVGEDRREERVTDVLANGYVGPVEGVGQAQQGVPGGATRAMQGGLVTPRGCLLLGRDAEVADWVDGDAAGGDPVANRGELADGEGEVPPGRKADKPNPGGVEVGGELVVRKDGADLGLEVGEGAGEGVAGSLGVVECDDEGVVLVGKLVVPCVVVRGVADDEAAAVDGEHEGQGRRQGGGLGLAVVCGWEEDADGQPRPCWIRLDDGWVIFGRAAALPPMAYGHGGTDHEQLQGVDGQPKQDPREQ
jgi:hypothetical protein